MRLTVSSIEPVANPARGLGAVSRVRRLLLMLPTADLVVLVALSAYLNALSGWDSLDLGVALAYSLLCSLVLAAFVVLTTHVWPRGAWVTASACLLFSVLFVADLINSSNSSDMLLLLQDPVYFQFALLPFAALGALVHWLRRPKPGPVEARAETSY